MHTRTTYMVCFLLAFTMHISLGQNLDSLKQVYKNLRAGSHTVENDTSTCYVLAHILDDCDDNEVQAYASQMKEIAEKNLATLPANSPFVKTCQNYRAIALNDLGIYYREKGDIATALDYLHESIRIHDSLKQRYQVGQIYNNIATVYYDVGDRAKALEYFEKGYAILKDTGDVNHLAPLIVNLAFINYVNRNFKAALKYYNICQRLAEKAGSKRFVSKCINGTGLVYAEQGLYKEALDCYKKSLVLCDEVNDKKLRSDIITNIANCYIFTKNYSDALPYGEASFKAGQELNNISSIRQAAYSLKRIYAGLGRYKEALDMEELYIQMRDSTNNVMTRKMALKKQLEYEYDKKEIILKEEQAKLTKLYEQRQRFILILSVVLVLLILIVFYSLYLRYKFKKEEESKNLHIELKYRLKQEIKEKESIANSLIHIQEHEREKLAAELHDGVNQLLFAAKIQLQASKSVDEPMHRDAVNLVDNAINEIKSIAANEGSFLLKNKSLKDALTDLILQMKGGQPIEISFLNYGFEESRLSPDQKTNSLRIIQELLSNAIRHSSAVNAVISVKTTADTMLFSVSDNGKGFDVNKAVKGNGLKNVSNKVSLMKGTRRIFSIAGKGTKIFIVIPLA